MRKAKPPSPEEIDAAFGRVLREERTARGLSQEQLGHESGSGRTFISELERGEKGASVKTLFLLSHSLGIAPSSLLERVSSIINR